MPDITRREILLKFIHDVFDATIDIDLFTILRDQTSENTTPVLYSLMNVWRQSQRVIIREDVMYEYENKLTKIFKTYSNDEYAILLEFFRLVIVNELDDLSLYIDMSERLSYITLFIFACFYNDENIQPLVCTVNNYVDSTYDTVSAINKEVVSVLGGVI